MWGTHRARLGGDEPLAPPAYPVRLLRCLLVTPVLPVAGVALAYGRRVDPAYELLAFGGLPQIGYAMAAVLSAGIVASRWRSLDRGGARWARPSAFAG